MVGYRTYIVSGLMAVFGTLATLNWDGILNNPKAGVAIVVSSVIMAVMRSLTTTPPGAPK